MRETIESLHHKAFHGNPMNPFASPVSVDRGDLARLLDVYYAAVDHLDSWSKDVPGTCQGFHDEGPCPLGVAVFACEQQT